MAEEQGSKAAQHQRNQSARNIYYINKRWRITFTNSTGFRIGTEAILFTPGLSQNDSMLINILMHPIHSHPHKYRPKWHILSLVFCYNSIKSKLMLMPPKTLVDSANVEPELQSRTTQICSTVLHLRVNSNGHLFEMVEKWIRLFENSDSDKDLQLQVSAFLERWKPFFNIVVALWLQDSKEVRSKAYNNRCYIAK